MNILFTFLSIPHLSEPGLFNDLIKEFHEQGHNVKVAAPLSLNTKSGVNKEVGIEVLRFKTGQLIRNKSNVKKGIAYIKYIFQANNAIIKHFRKENFDLIVAHSLPPESGILIRSLKRRYKAKFYLILCDYIWQNAVSLGFIKKKGVICKYYKMMESVLIKNSDYIGTPSQGNIDFITNIYPSVKNKNIKILHHSQAPVVLKDCNKVALKKKFDLENKFIVVYGGNVSIAQKMENVIDLAAECLQYEDIVFLIIGRGPTMDAVKEDVKKRGVNNVRFVEFMPKNEYEELIAICDVGMVSLNEKLGVPNIPSKTLSYFSQSIPIVASIDKVTDYGKYLETAQAGLWSIAGDIDSFKNNLIKLYENPDLVKKMGKNGNMFYLENMLSEKAYATIMKQIEKQTTI